MYSYQKGEERSLPQRGGKLSGTVIGVSVKSRKPVRVQNVLYLRNAQEEPQKLVLRRELLVSKGGHSRRTLYIKEPESVGSFPASPKLPN